MRLRKTFKNSIELVGRNADSCIADRKSNGAGQGEFWIPHHSHRDGPAIDKFECVADEVNEDLVESVGVSNHGTRDVRRKVAGELKAFFIGSHGQNLNGLFNQVAQIKVGLFQIQMGDFDFRQVEDVVNQRQQISAGAAENAQVLPLIGSQIRFP